MISFYKWKKNAVFVILGIIPLMIFLLIFFPTIKFYTLEGMQFMYLDLMNVFISIIASIVTAIIIIIIGNRMMRHAFTDMLEGKGLFTMILDSTGLIGSFNVKVMAPKMKGVFSKNVPPIEDTYDMDLLHRLLVPKNAGMTKGYYYTKNENDEIVLDKQVDVIVLPEKEDVPKHSFMFENRPVFIFNKVMNKFLSRDALAKFEKDIEIKHNALNILKKVQETDVNFRNFGRYIGENIKPMKKGFFASPMMKYILIAAVVGLIIFILMMFVPGILSSTSNLGMP